MSDSDIHLSMALCVKLWNTRQAGCANTKGYVYVASLSLNFSVVEVTIVCMMLHGCSIPIRNDG
jgi:hypothetical protein